MDILILSQAKKLHKSMHWNIYNFDNNNNKFAQILENYLDKNT